MSARPPQEDRERELAALLEISRVLASNVNLRGLAQAILEQLKTVIDYTGASVVTLEPDGVEMIESVGPDGREEEAVGKHFPMDGNSAWYRSMASGAPSVIPDVRADDELARAFRGAFGDPLEAPHVKYIRSWIGVPLKLEDRVSGILSLSKDEPGFFTKRHLDLVQAVARQASVVAENARLFEQTQAQTQELSTLLEISRVLASNVSLRGLVQAILEQLKAVIDYSGAAVVTFDAGGIEVVEAMGPAGREDEVIGLHFPMEESNDWFRRTSSGEIVLIPDVMADDALGRSFREAFGAHLDQPYVTYIRSWIGVPLSVDDRVVGMLSLSKDEPGFFTQRHLDLVQTVARQAAVVAENARLFEQTQAQTRELGALLEVSGAMASTLELEPLLDVILDRLRTLVEYDGASVMLGSGRHMVQLAYRRPSIPGLSDAQDPLPRETDTSDFSIIAGSLNRGEAVIINDVWEDTPRGAEYRRQWGGDLRGTRVEYVHSFLCVPLVVRDRTIGNLSVAHGTPGHFTGEHARLTRAFADQAAIAIENARLFEQTQTQTKELSALLDVARALSTTLDLRELMAVVLDNLKTIIDHSGSAFVLLEGDTLVIHDARSIASTQREIGARMDAGAASGVWVAISAGQEVIISDIRGDEPMAVSYRQAIGSIGLLDVEPFSIIRSWMAVPLTVKDEVVGMITMSSPEIGHFSPEQARVARAFAGQASIAIENARLFEQSAGRARETEALLRSDEELFRSLDPDVVLQALVDVTVDLLGAEKSMVAMWDEERQRVTLRAWRNMSDHALTLIHEMYEQARPGMENSEIMVTEDPAEAHPLEMKVVEYEGLRSFIQVPVNSGGVRLGFFAVAYTTEHHFTDGEKRLLSAVADRAAVAISNADLHGRAQQAASLEERQRLARELHDSVSQALYGIALGARTARTQLDRDPAKAIEPLDYVMSLAEAGLAEMRALIFELRPESLESEGLIAALEKQVAATSARYGIAIDANLGEEPDVRIEAKECLYRIGQEALHNMVKHARATEASISLHSDNGHLNLTITDNGQGFDTDGDFAGHLGLQSMRERAESCDGNVTIESAVGKGTTIRAAIPA